MVPAIQGCLNHKNILNDRRQNKRCVNPTLWRKIYSRCPIGSRPFDIMGAWLRAPPLSPLIPWWCDVWGIPRDHLFEPSWRRETKVSRKTLRLAVISLQSGWQLCTCPYRVMHGAQTPSRGGQSGGTNPGGRERSLAHVQAGNSPNSNCFRDLIWSRVEVNVVIGWWHDAFFGCSPRYWLRVAADAVIGWRAVALFGDSRMWATPLVAWLGPWLAIGCRKSNVLATLLAIYE